MNHALELLRRLDRAAADERSRGELDRMYDELVQVFGDLAEADRGPVREAYNRCACWATHEFWTSHRSYSRRFGEAGQPRDLRRGLAHYAMSDGYPDQRDVILEMNDLMAVAEKYGVQHESIVREVAALSSPQDRGFSSMKTLMERLL